MYKTTWSIEYKEEGHKQRVILSQYHFGKTPRFPSWYMENNQVYTIGIAWKIKIGFSFSTFMKCLFHHYVIN